ncbi:MAG: 50S ribosomal protein L4 [Oscillospiraceae bacterium]|nr:MAG: 50S ribosomal protein L4 [Oscillospiraceae bacterium]
MPKVAVYNLQGSQTGEIELSDTLFAADINKAVIHQVVRAQLANKRQGTKCTLTRTEVRGGGKKPYRQKGTGRARQGSIRSPQFNKGGVVFAPKPRSFRIAVPKKMKRLALEGVLTDKVVCNNFVVVENLALEAPKTKEMVKVLGNLKLAQSKTLIITAEPDETVARAAGNIPAVATSLVNTINVVDVLKADKLLITKEAVERLQEVYN